MLSGEFSESEAENKSANANCGVRNLPRQIAQNDDARGLSGGCVFSGNGHLSAWSLIYIRPLYLRAADGRIPELKRVIVAHQNQIMMDDTLDQALDRLFPSGERQTPRPPARTAGAGTLTAR
jgi:hypothetical protein